MAFKLTNSPFQAIEEVSGPGDRARRQARRRVNKAQRKCKGGKCKARSAYKANRGDRSFEMFNAKHSGKRHKSVSYHGASYMH